MKFAQKPFLIDMQGVPRSNRDEPTATTTKKKKKKTIVP